MVFKLGSNVLSLTVQRNLSRSTQDLSTASERLASGQRINRASDDAAGLAISMSLNVDSRVFTQGVRNLNDGLSAVTIADAAINELTSITQRIEELAVQSMNGTFSDTQRSSMQREVTALQAEWNRTVESTTFNGLNLLTGSGTGMVLQGGKGAEGTLAVQIGSGSTGGTTRVSTDSAGNETTGVGTTNSIAISADGRFVAFNSSSSSLVAGDTNGSGDTFVKDTRTGVTTRVSTDSAGNEGNAGGGIGVVLSADGRFVGFSSSSTNLDASGLAGIFMKDTLTGVTTRVNTDNAGNPGNAGGTISGISADGRFVAFDSTATNLVAGDTNGVRDVFLKDMLTGLTTRLSVDIAGNQGNLSSSVTGMSDDGRFVLFRTISSNFVAGDTNGAEDFFLRDTVLGVTTRVNTDSAGNQQVEGVNLSQAALSSDGRFVAFTSSATSLVSGDTNGQNDIFMKDTQTGVLSRISTDSAGNEASGGGSNIRALSADGRFVAFSSFASNLVAGDTNATADFFLKDTLTGATRRVSTDSQGNQADNWSLMGAISADGRYVAFNSFASNLVANDTNASWDIFVKDLTQLGVQTMAGMVVSNRASANVTLGLVQRYRNELLQYRSSIGASTQRIQSFMSNLDVSSDKFKSAESRVVDTDIAAEVAESLRVQILRQSATSLLRQANLAPQISLDLLRNA